MLRHIQGRARKRVEELQAHAKQGGAPCGGGVLELRGDLTRAHGEVVVRLDSRNQQWLHSGPHAEGAHNTKHGVVKGPSSKQIRDELRWFSLTVCVYRHHAGTSGIAYRRNGSHDMVPHLV